LAFKLLCLTFRRERLQLQRNIRNS
jgi:hypothetical protein